MYLSISYLSLHLTESRSRTLEPGIKPPTLVFEGRPPFTSWGTATPLSVSGLRGILSHSLTCWVGSWRGVRLAAVSRHAGCIDCGPRCVHVGLFLELSDVFLVSDSLVPEPVWYLTKIVTTRHSHLDANKLKGITFGNILLPELNINT